MRYSLCIILILLLCNVCFAGNTLDFLITAHDTSHNRNRRLIYKVVLHLMNHSKIKGRASEFTDNSVLITTHNRMGDTISEIMSANNIYKIKIRRKAFLTGAELGMVSGFVTGVLVVLVCSKDTSVTTLEIISGLILGLPVTIPGAVTGSIVSTIITKRNFEIDGDEKKFEAMHVRLQKTEDFFKQ